MREARTIYWWIGLFFALKIGVGLILLRFSALYLQIEGFADFSQLMLLGAFLSLILAGGLQAALVEGVSSAPRRATSAKAVMKAGFALWLITAGIICLLIVLLRYELAFLLLGNPEKSFEVAAVAILAIFATLPQLGCATLAGLGRGAVSLRAQTIGLVVGGCGSAYLLYRHNAIAAAAAFSIGPLLSLPYLTLKLWPLRAMPRERGGLWREMRSLASTSAAFIITGSIMPVVLILLRAHYRETFGVDALSGWILANRVSDISTQLLGIYMVQVFLPRVSSVDDDATILKIQTKGYFVSAGVAFSIVTAFALASTQLTAIFLGPRYAYASPGILLYLLGDLVRCGTMVALYTALGRRRRLTYLGIEVLNVTLFSLLSLELMALGTSGAPYYSYIASHGIILIIWLATLQRRSRRQARQASGDRAESSHSHTIEASAAPYGEK